METVLTDLVLARSRKLKALQLRLGTMKEAKTQSVREFQENIGRSPHHARASSITGDRPLKDISRLIHEFQAIQRRH
jgi:hypothetical protein